MNSSPRERQVMASSNQNLLDERRVLDQAQQSRAGRHE